MSEGFARIRVAYRYRGIFEIPIRVTRPLGTLHLEEDRFYLAPMLPIIASFRVRPADVVVQAGWDGPRAMLTPRDGRSVDHRSPTK